MRQITNSPEETIAFAKQIGAKLHAGDCIAYFGGLGMGKEDVVCSPTFAIVNEYHGAAGACSLYHFDMYRILCPEELESTGFYDYPLEENVFAIEWAEHIADVLPPHTIRITINQLAEETREIIIEGDERFC